MPANRGKGRFKMYDKYIEKIDRLNEQGRRLALQMLDDLLSNKKNRKDYEKALYDYSAAGNVTDASDRLLNLQGQIYNRAIELREEHSYEEAIYLFTILGDYLSSARQAVECEQIFRDEQYSQADAMEMAGDLQGAYDLFSTLTGFRDAAQRASDLASRLGIPDTSESD